MTSEIILLLFLGFLIFTGTVGTATWLKMKWKHMSATEELMIGFCGGLIGIVAAVIWSANNPGYPG